MLARVYCYKGDAESKGLATEYAKEVIAASKYLHCTSRRLLPITIPYAMQSKYLE